MNQLKFNSANSQNKINNSKKLIFPSGFYWGAATSSHQVEGNNYNDWSEWEHANSARLAAEAARCHTKASTRIPDYILNPPAGGPNPFEKENYISGRACDHYNRFNEDFDIAKKLSHNAHRFSIEWSRIEPKEGKFNEKEIEHYRQVIKALKSRGIEPFVTLWHWPVPLWLRNKGGVASRKFPKYFACYAEKMAQELGAEVKFWITINEPEIYSGMSYLRGEWPPQKKNLICYLRVSKNLIKAHKVAYVAIKKINPRTKIGIAKNNIYFEATGNKFCALKFLADWWQNFYFLNQIKNYLDFIGLNYYYHNRIKNFKFNQNENKKVSDMGWEIYPEGIYHILKDLKKYNKPIYITENGLADAKDEKRAKFIKDHLKWTYRAIQEGVDVRGYFYWSLLDNFEWDKGFWPRLGLVETDYRTLNRKIRPSALEYAKICKNNNLII